MKEIEAFLQSKTAEANWVNLAISIAIATMAVLVLLKLERKFAGKWFSKSEDINKRFLEKFLRFLIIFVAAMLVLLTSDATQAFGQAIFQGTAVIAAIAGFAAKPVLSDMLCGFMISTTRPFNIGDRIELDDGTTGIVRDITIRHVVLQGIDTLKIIIPNSEVNARMITNLSHRTKTRSIHFRFTVGLNSNTDQVKRIIQEAIRDSRYTVPREGEDYSPVYFLAYLDSGLQMATTVYYTPDSPTEVVKDDVNSRVKRALDANNIEIPYNYITLSAPPDAPDGGAQ